jgi:hypothetical protein
MLPPAARPGWRLTSAALLLAATACGGHTVALAEGGSELADASTEDGGGAADAEPDGEGPDQRGPPPVPVCTGEPSVCRPPDAGVVWTGVAVVQCQPVQYKGPWTLLLERLIGGNYQVIEKRVVQYPWVGQTFRDPSGPPTVLTYRVCALENNNTVRCGSSFRTQGPPHCNCQPTSCYLQAACNSMIDDGCGGTLLCGACPGGATCSGGTCCAAGYMADGWGGCVCAPVDCQPVNWNTVTCTCDG